MKDINLKINKELVLMLFLIMLLEEKNSLNKLLHINQVEIQEMEMKLLKELFIKLEIITKWFKQLLIKQKPNNKHLLKPNLFKESQLKLQQDKNNYKLLKEWHINNLVDVISKLLHMNLMMEKRDIFIKSQLIALKEEEFIKLILIL